MGKLILDDSSGRYMGMLTTLRGFGGGGKFCRSAITLILFSTLFLVGGTFSGSTSSLSEGNFKAFLFDRSTIYVHIK